MHEIAVLTESCIKATGAQSPDAGSPCSTLRDQRRDERGYPICPACNSVIGPGMSLLVLHGHMLHVRVRHRLAAAGSGADSKQSG